MFNYDPMTEEQAMKERYQLMKDGEYEAVIDAAEAKISRNGNNQIEVQLSVYDEHGKTNSVRDFWVFTPKMMWKIIHGCDSAGLAKEYEDKKFHPEMLPGRNVRVIIGTQTGNEIPADKLNGKPAGSRYPDKNVVEDYVKKADQGAVAKVAPSQVDDFDSDQIPF